MKLDPEIQALWDKMMGGSPTGSKPKKKAAADPITQAVRKTIREAKLKEKEKRGYQSGNGTDYVKKWDEQGIGYRMVPRARFEFEKIIGRDLRPDERVFLVDRRIKDPAKKYSRENMLLGDQSGVYINLLACKCCGTIGQWTNDYEDYGKEGNPSE